jgi:patatin-like phospholipase/acyl hydrolase
MSVWGALAERYETEKPQRKLLALDGGGIRGVITLEILARWNAISPTKPAEAILFVSVTSLTTLPVPAPAQ